MARIATLFVFALVVGYAAAAFLAPASVRVVEQRDLVGTYSRITNSDACPNKVKHEKAEPAFILHQDMLINTQKCTSKGRLNLSKATDTGKMNEIRNIYQGNPSLARVNELIDAASKADGALVGIETEDRVCPSFTIKKNSIVVFVKEAKPISLGSAPPIKANVRGMAFVNFGQTFTCVYTAKLRAPRPTPTVSAIAPGTPGQKPQGQKTGQDKKPGSNNVTPEESESPQATTTPSPSNNRKPGDGNTGKQSAGESSPEPSEAPICFPGGATVELENGSTKTMAELELGDRVLVADKSYSDIFMFTHKTKDVKHSFVQITTASGAKITLTSGHYLSVNGVFAPAKSVAVGDALVLGNGDVSTVASVSTVMSTGLYNPQTVHGTIVVNNVLASTYTTTIDLNVAHSLLTPVRMVYNFFGLTMKTFEQGADTIASFMPKGKLVY